MKQFASKLDTDLLAVLLIAAIGAINPPVWTAASGVSFARYAPCPEIILRWL